MPICEICGRLGADCLCVKCGRVICEGCFHGFGELCVDCAPQRAVMTASHGISSAGLRMLGMLLIVFGLMIASIALLPEDAEGVVVIFPFVIGNVSGTAAAVLAVVFLGMFMATALLPWFLYSRRRGPWDGYGPFRWEPRPSKAEMMEYMITIEIPAKLRDTVYIEEETGLVHLRSRADPSFHRSYTLPEGFDVDDYSYEYDGGYLILKLKLERRIF